MASDLYFGDASLNKQLFSATAIVTAPVIWSTAAGTGGPLLWNSSTAAGGVLARVVAVGFAVTTASTVAGALGLAWGATTAPSSTAAVASTGNCYSGGPKSSCTVYATGTTSAAATVFLPFAQITTGALTVSRDAMTWIPLNRLITVPPGQFVSVAGSATLSTAVIQVGLVWEEISLP